MEHSPPISVLVLCTGNSARSILAEGLINHRGAPRFRAFSAGSRPTGRVNPLALKTLEAHGIAVKNARSKSWDEFAQASAPQMQLVITVCDSAAGETCPLWPGAPLKAHWGLPDPAAASGSEAQKSAEFEKVYRMLETRVKALVALKQLDVAAIQRIHQQT
jgi:arsenate reductase